MTKTSTAPGFCLVATAEGDADHLSRIARALDATRTATLILTAPRAGGIDTAVARTIVEIAQQKQVAVLIADDVSAVRATGADGVHLSWRPEIEDAYEAARTALGPDAIVGADAGESRHDAMTLGEAGADYVAFGRMSDADDPDIARDTQRELVEWWADVFVVPVVAFDIGTADDARDLVERGADFIAVRLPDRTEADKDATWASALVTALAAAADAA